ncbi:TetR family transcriptional regulator [Spiractinospora alimapuensis]|uniref:TetR/AcrR family transcriptional regulator n=1 Tax=Spiractinospora alimapuensis TaxID=2820884 RepID=UPI001F27F6CD|nr:TetR/AcrR family transcriptional regulator [Spiractinospora alimapuensis]QVQ51961.1 TetR family transcriptional regulator [Spiractinospora alimapuensis]
MSQQPGLRERKRRAAMRHVQHVALDLFDEYGFSGVTIDQIAEVAEVSPSSVYRYFGTKEGLVLVDPSGGDSRIQSVAREARGAEVIGVARARLVDYLTHGMEDDVTQRRVRYLMEVPALQAAMSQKLFERLRFIGEEFAREHREDDGITFDIQVALGATYGAVLGALQYWHATSFSEPLTELLDRTLATLSQGLPDQTSSPV